MRPCGSDGSSQEGGNHQIFLKMAFGCRKNNKRKREWRCLMLAKERALQQTTQASMSQRRSTGRDASERGCRFWMQIFMNSSVKSDKSQTFQQEQLKKSRTRIFDSDGMELLLLAFEDTCSVLFFLSRHQVSEEPSYFILESLATNDGPVRDHLCSLLH